MKQPIIEMLAKKLQNNLVCCIWDDIFAFHIAKYNNIVQDFEYFSILNKFNAGTILITTRITARRIWWMKALSILATLARFLVGASLCLSTPAGPKATTAFSACNLVSYETFLIDYILKSVWIVCVWWKCYFIFIPIWFYFIFSLNLI